MKFIHKLFFILFLRFVLGQKESDISKPEKADLKVEKSEPEIENSQIEEENLDSKISESEDDDIIKKLEEFEFNTDELNMDDFNLDEFNIEEEQKKKKNQKGKNENKQKTKKQKPKPLVAGASKKFKDLFSWGKNNSLNFSKIMRFNKNNKLAAEKFISIDDIVLDIPPEVMLNVKTALSLLNSKKMRKAYSPGKPSELKIISIIKNNKGIKYGSSLSKYISSRTTNRNTNKKYNLKERPASHKTINTETAISDSESANKCKK